MFQMWQKKTYCPRLSSQRNNCGFRYRETPKKANDKPYQNRV